MKLNQLFLTAILSNIVLLHLNAGDYNIINYGAVSDTTVLSTEAIQKSIDECSAQGGGRVIIPAGHYKTGTLVIKSNVGLYLEPGAVLFGSRNLKDYKPLKPEYVSLRTQEATVQLIYAENAQNISISGFGEINGQGSGFKKMSWNDEGITRPHLLRFITCRNVRIENIALKNSACWMQHYLACEEVQISGIRIFNRNNFNNDGLDIDGCRNVTISDVISDSDDDGITLKSTSPRPCENVAITNCVISSRCNAIKMGTESNGGFRNISISNCVIKPSQLAAPAFFGTVIGTSGISLEIVDGGTMMGITISNIQIEGTESPIFIRLGNRARPYRKGMEIKNVGVLGDISIDQVRIRNAGNTGCSITGLPGFPVHNIRLSNIYFQQAGGCGIEESRRDIPEKPADYPEATMFGALPASGFFIRHASNVTLDRIEFAVQMPDQRPSVYIDDVDQGFFTNMLMQGQQGSEASFILNHARDILIQGCTLRGRSDCFVKVHGAGSSAISLINNMLRGTTTVFSAEFQEPDLITASGNIQ